MSESKPSKSSNPADRKSDKADNPKQVDESRKSESVCSDKSKGKEETKSTKTNESRKSLDTTISDKDKDKSPALSKKSSFLKQLDSALGSGPPSKRTRPVSTGLTTNEEETKGDITKSKSNEAINTAVPDKDKEIETTPMVKKTSFLKELDSALGSGPRLPSVKAPPAVSTSSCQNSEEELRHLLDEVNGLKENFSSKLKNLQEVLSAQVAKIDALEKECKELKKVNTK
ncbi:uncharacterized protein LOC129586585 [Paramacrobiotus metropolitanus]|uniref:uncharacterized protein LOC129586585 n=1 Tax=Paramacrobiotus metropolitanus TaxID=2943436 RepID=UPI002445AAB9|nr:uncharacterized protein LOC129586585 [Paramacrobiotus metropolitanus]